MNNVRVSCFPGPGNPGMWSRGEVLLDIPNISNTLCTPANLIGKPVEYWSAVDSQLFQS